MKTETISERMDLIIRRHILEPGEALPWHTDGFANISNYLDSFTNQHIDA